MIGGFPHVVSIYEVKDDSNAEEVDGLSVCSGRRELYLHRFRDLPIAGTLPLAFGKLDGPTNQGGVFMSMSMTGPGENAWMVDIEIRQSASKKNKGSTLEVLSPFYGAN